MKNIFIKTVLFVTLSLGLFTSCVEEDDFDIPEIKEAFLFENFTNSKTGSGATEVPIAIKDWGNFIETAYIDITNEIEKNISMVIDNLSKNNSKLNFIFKYKLGI